MAGPFIEADLLDVGYGMPIVLSSCLGGKVPAHLVPSSDPGGAIFRTHAEDAPSLTVDLRCVRRIQRIRVFNSENEPERGVPLAVSVSQDGESWTEVHVATADFGGKVTQTPLVVALNYFVPCRYVRLQKRSHGGLRLHYVEICAPLPREWVGTLQNVRITETDILADYWHHESYGFSWTFSCTLGMIFNAQLLGVCIDQISYRLCLLEFKDDPDEDAYHWLFEARRRCPSDQPRQLPYFERHGLYASFQLDVLNVYADLYFRPHRRVRDFADRLVAEYGLDLSKTVVLLYRGTDKVIEITPAPPESYVAVGQALLRQEDGLSVLCQTDQAQARDVILSGLSGAISFRELPVTDGAQAIHNLNVSTEFGLPKSEIALRLLAVTYLVAQARYVVTHTGNLGAWVALYRGKSEGLYQFCEDGRLRGPDGAVLSLDLEPLPD